MSRFRYVVTVALAAGATAGCSKDVSAPAFARLQMGFAGLRPGSSAAGAPDSLVLSDGSNTLVVAQVQVLLRQVGVRRTDLPGCNVALCEAALAHTAILTVPLTSIPGSGVSGPVDIDLRRGLATFAEAGSFIGVAFDIHALGADPIDRDLAARHPSWPSGASVVVSGRYNGAPFTYVGTLDEAQGVRFLAPLQAQGGGTYSLTVRFDVSSWFRAGVAGGLLDPTTANAGGANRALVEGSIRASIQAFPDANENGDERDG